jgi:hypothetical protein
VQLRVERRPKKKSAAFAIINNPATVFMLIPQPGAQ